MCLNYSERESILKEAAEQAGDRIRNAAWKRIKIELEIMTDTFNNSDDVRDENYYHKMEDLRTNFILLVESNCLHE